MTGRTTCGCFFYLFFPPLPLAAKERRQTGDQLRAPPKKEGEARSDQIEARKNCRSQRGEKMRRGEERWNEIILSKSPFISLSVAGAARLCPARYFPSSRGATFFLFSPFLPPTPAPSSPLPLPLLLPSLSHPQSGVTAIFSHIRPTLWLRPLCIHAGCSALKDFLTRPWIRLVASHSLFLSAWLDSDADIKWTLIQIPSQPVRWLVCLSALQVKQHRRPQAISNLFLAVMCVKRYNLWKPHSSQRGKKIRGKPDEIKGWNYAIRKKSKFKDQK